MNPLLAVAEAQYRRDPAAANIEGYFHYPGVPHGGDPYPHQVETVRHLVLNRRIACLNGIGTGKTLCAVWAAMILRELGEVKRVLVVAPPGVLERAWDAAFLGAGYPEAPKFLKGDRNSRNRWVHDPSVRLAFINPDGLTVLDHVPAFDLIIVDEATWFKHATSNRWRALDAVARGKRLWLVTGTPASQHPTDAHGLIKLIRNGQFMAFGAFRDMTMMKVSDFVYVPKRGAAEIVARELQPAVRFSREDCITLPLVHTLPLQVELSPAQRKAVDQLKKEAYTELEGKPITAANAAVVLGKVLQAMAGAIYVSNGRTREAVLIESRSLTGAIASVVREAEGPVLIYSVFQETVSRVTAALTAEGFNVRGVSGETPDAERAESLAAMEAGTIDALVATPQLVAEGLTFIHGNIIIWITPPFRADHYEQGNGRIHRLGQLRPCTIYQIVQDPLAEALFKRLAEKRSLQDTVLELLGRKQDGQGSVTGGTDTSRCGLDNPGRGGPGD